MDDTPKKKRRMSMKNVRKEEGESLLKVVPEDMLMEVLLRVSDSKTAIRSGSVCKAWWSVVNSPEFIPAFIRQHPPSPSSYTMLVDFRFGPKRAQDQPRVTQFRYCHNVITVDGSDVATAHPTTTRFRDIVPSLILESACHDLTLVAGNDGDELCVFRPDTRHRHVIPRRSPLHEHGGFRALAARPDRQDFRILHIGCVAEGRHKSSIYRSETGQWSDPVDAPTQVRRSDVVFAADGTLFWVESLRRRRAVVFDPFTGTWSSFPLPVSVAAQSSFCDFAPPGEVEEYGSNKHRIIVGVVKGRVRISQLFFLHPWEKFLLKVWELEDASGSWRVVHQVWVTPDVDAKWMYMLALDPDDGDVVFFCCDSDVYRFCIRKRKYRWVFRLSCSMDIVSEDRLPRYARATIITRPVWPTTVPACQTFTSHGRFGSVWISIQQTLPALASIDLVSLYQEY